jgi:hypothetical protein
MNFQLKEELRTNDVFFGVNDNGINSVSNLETR